jgi:hypothetical protein
MPVSTNAMTRGPQLTAAERNSGSIAARHILARTAPQTEGAINDEEVTRGWRHVHDPALDRRTVLRGDDPQTAMPERADRIPVLLSDMYNDQYGGR